eukprot:GSChrysophyteH1.ASY1.ANO1.2208.1 assembled CDS
MVTLTNMRLVIFVRTVKGTTAWAINLSTVHEVEDCAKGLLGRSTRIRICVNRTIQIEQVKQQLMTDIGLGFDRSGLGLEDKRKLHFLRTMQQALLKRKSISADEPATINTGKHGISGILRQHQSTLEEANMLTKEATQDLENLMQRAQEVVRLVDKFAKYSAQNSATGSEESGAEDGTDMNSILLSIGLVSPVTKSSTGDAYYEQLARQICDLLSAKNLLEKMGGMVTLTDLYCIYNRARGTSLVSPEDLRCAAELMGSLRLGMHLVTFTSGVIVVQSDSLSERSISIRMLSLFEDKQGHKEEIIGPCGLQATDVSRLLSLPLQVSQEHLLLAESKGYLCRDDSVLGLFFYKNLFM